MRTWLVLLVVVICTSLVTRPAHADEAEDLLWDLSRRAKSRLEVAAFTRSPAASGLREYGLFAEVGLAWDSPQRGPSRESVLRTAVLDPQSVPVVSLPITPRVARAAVHAAFRTARLAGDDAIDGLASRARWSGLVPELRLRGARIWDESARAEVLPSDALRTWDAARANLLLEARASFRLDRLVFADEELAALRLRLEQSEIAQRLALRVVAMLSGWQRAWVEARAAPAGSVAALEAALRLGELEATLDVVTGGWFSSWRAREVR